MRQPTTEEFISYLKELDIQLWREGDYLRCNAPKEMLTSDLRTQITERKAEILAFIDKFVSAESASFPQQSLPVIVPNVEERYQPFPLTDVQQAYWIGRNGTFELSNISTHVYFEIETFDLDLEIFEKAWQRLIARHEMLRVIVHSDGQQQILAQVPPYKVKVTDLCGINFEQVNSELTAIRDQLSHQVLPADQWPLFEIQVAQLDQGKARIYMSIDSLIADGWSLEILLADLVKLIQDPTINLAPHELSFRDYVLAEVALRESDIYSKSQAYWQSRLAALPSSPELPLRKDLAAVKSPHFVRRRAKVAPEAWNRLKKRAVEANLTTSGLLLAAFAEILTTWSKSSHFTINLTLFNRLPLHPEVNQIVGDFTSLSLLEVDNSETGSFESRAQRIQRQLWDDLKYRHYSGVKVLRELAQIQNRPLEALMPIVFTSSLARDSLKRGKSSHAQLNGMSSEKATPAQGLGEGVFGISQTPQVYLDHQVYEIEGSLALSWDAVEEVFPPGLLDDMFSAYCDFVNRLANEDELWRETQRQLLPPEQIQQLTALNKTETSMPEGALLHTLFFDRAALHQQKIALVTSKQTLTYQELSDRSNQLGVQLRQLGARPNQLVAIVMEKGWEQAVATLGILVSGAAYLPIDPALPTERRQHLLEAGKVQWIITQSKLEAALEWPEGIIRLCIDDTTVPPRFSTPLAAILKASDLDYVIFTSCYTGYPKGVMID
ncbi:MAG: condensation domain-containing protein, partial [Cyanobacteria bacterium P01_F01_bin.86]